MCVCVYICATAYTFYLPCSLGRLCGLIVMRRHSMEMPWHENASRLLHGLTVTGGLPLQGAHLWVARSFFGFSLWIRLNMLFNRRSSCERFETLWCSRDVTLMYQYLRSLDPIKRRLRRPYKYTNLSSYASSQLLRIRRASLIIDRSQTAFESIDSKDLSPGSLPLLQLLFLRHNHKFAHVMRAQLLWHVQNWDLFWSLLLKQGHHDVKRFGLWALSK